MPEKAEPKAKTKSDWLSFMRPTEATENSSKARLERLEEMLTSRLVAEEEQKPLTDWRPTVLEAAAGGDAAPLPRYMTDTQQSGSRNDARRNEEVAADEDYETYTALKRDWVPQRLEPPNPDDAVADFAQPTVAARNRRTTREVEERRGEEAEPNQIHPASRGRWIPSSGGGVPAADY